MCKWITGFSKQSFEKLVFTTACLVGKLSYVCVDVGGKVAGTTVDKK